MGRLTTAPIRTFGHGTLTADEIVDVLRGAGIDAIADVRRYPASRRHPHVARDQMEHWLPEAGIAYLWIPELGGRRKPSPSSPHVALRNEQFRAYADHMTSDDFATGLSKLFDLTAGHATAVMCAESVWWRCHRRLLADHLLAVRDVAVEHLFHDGRLDRHRLTPEARLVDGLLVYDDGDTQLPLDIG